MPAQILHSTAFRRAAITHTAINDGVASTTVEGLTTVFHINPRDSSATESELTERIIQVAQHKYPATDEELVRAVIAKVMVVKPNYPTWLDGSFSNEDRKKYRELPLHAALEIAGLGLDRVTLSKSIAIIAQLAHTRIADGSLKSDELRQLIVDMYKSRKAQGSELSVEENEEVNEITWLSEECAAIRRHPYATYDSFAAAGILMNHLNSVGADNEYAKGKYSYEDNKTRVIKICEAGESYILNSRYPGRTFLIRGIDTQHEQDWLSKKKPSLLSPAGSHLRLMAQNTLFMYMPMLERYGIQRDPLGKLVMEALQPGEHDRIQKYIANRKREVTDELRDTVINAVRRDPKVKEFEEKYGLEITIHSREKTVYSAWQKIINDSIYYNKPLSIEKLHDLSGLRMVVERKRAGTEKLSDSAVEEKASELVQDIWRLIQFNGKDVKQKPQKPTSANDDSIVHSTAEAGIPLYYFSRERNYIEKPKPNGYRACHLTVEQDNERVEIQILTKTMADNANFGDAFHGDHKNMRSVVNEKIADQAKGTATDQKIADQEKVAAKEVTADPEKNGGEKKEEVWTIDIRSYAPSLKRKTGDTSKFVLAIVNAPRSAKNNGQLHLPVLSDNGKSVSVDRLIGVVRQQFIGGFPLDNLVRAVITGTNAGSQVYTKLEDASPQIVGNNSRVSFVLPAQEDDTRNRRILPNRVVANRRDMRQLLAEHLDERVHKGAAPFTYLPSQYISVRTPNGTAVDLPIATDKGVQLPLLNQVRLMAIFTKNEELFEKLWQLRINGEISELSADRLRRPLRNADAIEIMSNSIPLHQQAWAKAAFALSSNGWNDYAVGNLAKNLNKLWAKEEARRSNTVTRPALGQLDH